MLTGFHGKTYAGPCRVQAGDDAGAVPCTWMTSDLRTRRVAAARYRLTVIDKRRVYRHWPSAIVQSVIVLGFAVVVDLMWWLGLSDPTPASAVLPTVVAVGALALTALSLRHRPIADDAGVRVVTWRTQHVPWHAIERVDSLVELQLHLRDGEVQPVGFGTAPIWRMTGLDGFGERVARELNAELARRRGIAVPRIDADRHPRRKAPHVVVLMYGIPLSLSLISLGFRVGSLWLFVPGLITVVATGVGWYATRPQD